MEPHPPSSPPRSPRKRLRMDDGAATDVTHESEDNQNGTKTEVMDSSSKPIMQPEPHKESEVGILYHVSPDVAGFEGLLKKRYTDFMVNEVLLDGTVLHLDSVKVPVIPRPKKTKTGNETKQSNEGLTESTEGPDANEKSTSQPEKTHDAPKTQNAPAAETESGEGNDEAATKAAGVAAWQNYAEQQKGLVLSGEDREALESFLGTSETDETLALFNRILDSPHRKPAQYGTVRSAKTIDRASRTKLHEAVRRIFNSRLESYTEKDGTFVIAAASGTAFAGARNRRDQGRNKQTRDEGPRMSNKEKFAALGGDYLHFSLYKENKDTMEVIAFMARTLQLSAKVFQFAGTKDRRAITVQRVSAHRVWANNLANLNNRLRNAKLGNFSYEQKGLVLGELGGNEFVITLRECSFAGTEDLPVDEKKEAANGIVHAAMKHLMEFGFINYYGMQRFGTFHMRTDLIGTQVLRGDYESAVNLLLHFSSDVLEAAQSASEDPLYSNDDKNRALGIKVFQDTGNAEAALAKLPRKFSGELNAIRWLGGKGNKRDFLGAIMSIPRALRLMYVHAYQSLIWNHAASHRWAMGGAVVLEGDLVLVNEHKDEEAVDKAINEVDEDGEPIVHPGAHDRAVTDDERFERARALTKEEAESGKYSIYDIVLPSPGFDVLYPAHMVKFYEELMAKEEFGRLNPHDMRRNIRDFSLSGHYRKLLARPQGSYNCRVVGYKSENKQFNQTDVDRLYQAQHRSHAEHKAIEQPIADKREAKSKLKAIRKAAPQEPGEVDYPVGMEYPMGMDGAVVSTIRDIKDSLLATGTEEENDSDDGGVNLAPEEGQSRGIKENDEMDTTAADDQDDDDTNDEQPVKLAVLLTLQLGSSTYATMALRELSKGGIKAYKPEFGGVRRA